MKRITRAFTGLLAVFGLIAFSAALAVDNSPGGPCINETNLQPLFIKIAQELYNLHTIMLILCTVIFVGVFGVMFYSVFAHRKSSGNKAAHFHESTTVEIIWTIVPFVIVVLMALPATKSVVEIEGRHQCRPDREGHRLPVERGLRLGEGAGRRVSASSRC
ncbi:MAG: hypothetical protein E5299_01783 [Burkholderia gladioli]|nr:MAG: hypothetical protein E5299_01783 [Burkholderia gladioli]